MRTITIMEERLINESKKNWRVFLEVQKQLVEDNFDWLQLKIDEKSKKLVGRGVLEQLGMVYKVDINYSPYNPGHYDRIYISNLRIPKSIKDEVHVYNDNSLCLYHPYLDKGYNIIPLYKILARVPPWITCYKGYLEYGVWLSKEIKHISF